MAKKNRKACGVGVNDADYPVSIYSVVAGKRKQIWMCPIYQTWSHMLKRCYSDKYQAKQPTYIGCLVAPEWHSFSSFRAWMLTQDHEGSHLDKDLLMPGNKVYSADTCVFVSRPLNNFLTDSGAARGDFPLGVSWHNNKGKFLAQCSDPATRKQKHLGYFTCQHAAHEAWRAKKHQYACIYADMQTDPRIAHALRTRYAKQSEGKSV